MKIFDQLCKERNIRYIERRVLLPRNLGEVQRLGEIIPPGVFIHLGLEQIPTDPTKG